MSMFREDVLQRELEDAEAALELAWAAGFFDGEGWTSGATQQGGKTQVFYLGISQKDIRPLERFASALGLSQNIHRNRMNTIGLSGALALRAFRKLWPYLSDPKREQGRASFEKAHAERSRRYPKLNAQYDKMARFLREEGRGS
jgi:hypothetical protein